MQCGAGRNHFGTLNPDLCAMMIRIIKIDLINGNNLPLVRSFTTLRLIDQKRVKAYKKRLKSFFETVYKKELSVNLTYTEIESKYTNEQP
jgi:hypothetical protein